MVYGKVAGTLLSSYRSTCKYRKPGLVQEMKKQEMKQEMRA